jgi:hypothetical protein
LCGGQLPPERVRLDVVGESANAVDLDDGEPLAIARLELGVAADVDLLELESQLVAQRGHLRQRALAEMAALRVDDPDDRYG